MHWFQSVARLATERGIEVVTPENPNSAGWVKRVRCTHAALHLSFYYRSMLGQPLLSNATLGVRSTCMGRSCPSIAAALRSIGPFSMASAARAQRCTTWSASLMPADRGTATCPDRDQRYRAHGIDRCEAATAASLLEDCLPLLAEGPLRRGPWISRKALISALARRRTGASTGRGQPIGSTRVIRAVAPPFPGAFTDLGPQRIVFDVIALDGRTAPAPKLERGLYVERGEHLLLDCADGLRLEIPSLSIDGQPLDARGFARLHGDHAAATRQFICTGNLRS